MKARIFVLGVVALVMAAATIVMWPRIVARAAGPTAPEVFASPVNGGCYIAAAGQCRLHIDPYTVNVGTGQRLDRVQVMANGSVVYDFRTDVSNPPPATGSTYTLSPVALDFAATCGTTYYINVVGKNLTDPSSFNLGQTAQFTCPANVP